MLYQSGDARGDGGGGGGGGGDSSSSWHGSGGGGGSGSGSTRHGSGGTQHVDENRPTDHYATLGVGRDASLAEVSGRVYSRQRLMRSANSG